MVVQFRPILPLSILSSKTPCILLWFGPSHSTRIAGGGGAISVPLRDARFLLFHPWWVSDSGRVCVSVRYGSKVLELAKGKTAIEVTDAQDLIKTLEAVKAAVLSGELDTQIEAASGALRSGFKK